MVKRTGSILLKALPLMVALLLYGYTIRLPFFLDDGPMLDILNRIPFWQVWGGFIGYQYYRPVPMTLWKVAWVLFGGHFDPAFLHLLNVLCFGLAGVVVGLLAGRIAPVSKKQVTLIAGVAFVVFPLSYQAVILVNAIFHPTLVLGFAVALWAAMHWMDNPAGRRGRIALAVCLVGAFFGIFSHENGPLLLPFAVGLIVLVYGFRALLHPRAWMVIVPIGVIALAYLILWMKLPIGHSPPQISAEPVRAFADLSEGLIYPLDMAMRPLVKGDANNTLIFALLGVTVVVGLLISHSRLAWYGLGWYFLAVIPSVLFLAPAYVLGSPHLMMLASVGMALFWAAILGRLWESRRFRFFTLAGTMAVIALTGVFLADRAYDYQRMGDYLWKLTHLSETLQSKDTSNSGKASDSLLVVNPPDFLAPLQGTRRFLLSTEGAAVMVDSYSYTQQVSLNAGQGAPPIDAIGSRLALRPPSDRLYVPFQPFVDGQPLYDLLHQRSGLIVTEFDGNNFWPVYVGAPDLPGPESVLATFDRIQLLQADATLSTDQRLVTVKLRWYLPKPTAAQPFIHVLCGSTFIGQADFAPWGGTYPFSQWRPGETETEIRQVLLKTPATPDCLHVQLGVYTEANAQRLKLTVAGVTAAAQKKRYADDLYPVTLTLPGQSRRKPPVLATF